MSKWGSWVTGAVAGLENRLDKVLADEDDASAKTRAAEAHAKEVAKVQKELSAIAASAEQPKTEPGMSRAASKSRPASNRLQERLAKAMVNKDGRSPSQTSMDLPSQTASPTTLDTSDTARSSIDSRNSEAAVRDALKKASKAIEALEEKNKADGPAQTTDKAEESAQEEEDISKPTTEATVAPEIPTIKTEEKTPRSSHESTTNSRTSHEQSKPAAPALEPEHKTLNTPEILVKEPNTPQVTNTQPPEDSRAEITAHLERIDALQTKLNYLSDQLSTASKAAAESASTGSPEKKIAEKDQQISELMKEGEKLSKKELQQSNLIKRLRVKVGEQDKEIADLKRRATKAEQTTTEERERTRRAETAEKASQEKLKVVARIEKEVDEIKREKDAAAVTIVDLRRQLAETISRAEQAEKKANSGALEAEQRKVKELEDELADAKIERKLAEDRSKAEVRDIKDEAARQAERAKVTEMELKSEVSNLETKLEVLRSRTEEVSSTGDSQTKLLRQIETLQTQYALASENWQGIESTLTSRVAALEKERDDVSKRESETRRKAREVNSKARRLEDELESANDHVRTLEQDIQALRSSSQRLETKAAQAETGLQEAKADFERQKKVWDSEITQRLEMEKAKWKTEMMSTTPTDASFLHAESPSVLGSSFRKHSNHDLAGLGLSGIHTRRTMGRTHSGAPSNELSLGLAGLNSPPSRRSSNMQVRTPELGTPKRQDSSNSMHTINGGMSQAPSIHAILDEEYENTSSPRHTINDVISASTAGAGPSVQLVERMSAAVRRLESEKATTKEEMSRILAQRDEARNEVVALMREIEEKRAADEKVTKLEAEIESVDKRYQTTLEMLGEKSERVDELVNDVEDLKKMYRDLIERTM